MKTTIQEITISKSQRRDEIAAFREQAARIAALEAALRDIEAAWDDDAIPTEDVGGRMYLIARAALAPAPAPADTMKPRAFIAHDNEGEDALGDYLTFSKPTRYPYTPLYALAPAPAPGGK